MNFKQFGSLLPDNPLCGIGTYKDELNLATGACTRQIKKLVLDGTEDWSLLSTYRVCSLLIADYLQVSQTVMCCCSHYTVAKSVYTTSEVKNNECTFCYAQRVKYLYIKDTKFTTISAFKQFLADEYAAGHPVTVWYVLDTPTTETITVPTGLSGIVEGYLNQSGTPTSANPIYPTANTVEQWFDTPHYIHNTSTDTITTPADIYVNDTTAAVGLKGNTVQNGTPTPNNPIQPQSCGERTGNLYISEITDCTINSGGRLITAENSIVLIAPIVQGKTYSINKKTFFAYFNNNPIKGDYAYGSTRNSDDTFTAPITGYVAVKYLPTDTNKMINEGSTALPYEPYGIKIPILCGNQTTNIYLGETQSTRAVKKLVLTGEENWEQQSGQTADYFRISNMAALPSKVFCTHFLSPDTDINYASTVTGIKMQQSSSYGVILACRPPNVTGLANFKSFLATQYANGTPVTVWYVLATPETGVVNEPLMKIGDYADEVANVSIPVTAGGDTLSVGTTVQPSEVTVNYKGWHPVADVHVYPDSSWMPTSWEEFRKAVRSGKAQSLYPVGTKLYENWGDETSNAWVIVDYPNDSRYIDPDLSAQGYTNRVVLMEEKLNYSLTYDTKDAWMYVETALPAGSYRFTIPNYDVAHGGNKTYIFTSTADVPVGGQLTLTWSNVSNPSAVQGYSSQTSETALFDVSISEWDGTTACTDLGTIKKTISDPDSQYGKMNSIERARMSSDNYYQSGIRQWLNASEASNWWTPSNVFDRPYANRTTAGRLSTLDGDMKAVLATPSINCITNNIFESPSLDGTTFSLNTVYTVRDKLFLPSHTEVNLSQSPSVNTAFEYYVDAQNTDRIKYRSNGTAYSWWTRVPTSIEAQRVNIVSTNGTWSNPSGGSTNGVAACCVIQ